MSKNIGASGSQSTFSTSLCEASPPPASSFPPRNPIWEESDGNRLRISSTLAPICRIAVWSERRLPRRRRKRSISTHPLEALEFLCCLHWRVTPVNDISEAASVVPRERALLSGRLMSLRAGLIVVEVKRFLGGAIRVPRRLEARGSPFHGVSPRRLAPCVTSSRRGEMSVCPYNQPQPSARGLKLRVFFENFAGGPRIFC